MNPPCLKKIFIDSPLCHKKISPIMQVEIIKMCLKVHFKALCNFTVPFPPLEHKVLPPAGTAVCLYPYYSVSIFIQFQFLKMSTCVLYLNHSFLSFCSFAFYVTLKLSNLLQCANLTNCSFFYLSSVLSVCIQNSSVGLHCIRSQDSVPGEGRRRRLWRRR